LKYQGFLNHMKRGQFTLIKERKKYDSKKLRYFNHVASLSFNLFNKNNINTK